MNLFVPFLMLTVPGIIAVCVHSRQLIHITRKNWQPLMWIYLLYSFAIVFTVNVVMWLSFPQRTISYSPQITWATSNVLSAGFVVKYILFSAVAAFGLPKFWERRHKMLNLIIKRKSFKISDDE